MSYGPPVESWENWGCSLLINVHAFQNSLWVLAVDIMGPKDAIVIARYDAKHVTYFEDTAALQVEWEIHRVLASPCPGYPAGICGVQWLSRCLHAEVEYESVYWELHSSQNRVESQQKYTLHCTIFRHRCASVLGRYRLLSWRSVARI